MISDEKQALRQDIRRLRHTYSAAQLAQWSAQLCEKLEAHPQFVNAHSVMLYHALPDEVDFCPLLDRWSGTKRLILPKVCGSLLTLHLYEGPASLSVGAFGIMEPNNPPLPKSTDLSLIVVPGMAFDHNGHRLGRGRGYYDTLLSTLPPATYRLGVAFPFQITEYVPTEAHDMRVDEVLY